ncbi:MAG: hypothetical protein Q7J84_10225 [Sulfuricaulis sp.]|nr:hypothetical protein [Sulfuricaulis sp.]
MRTATALMILSLILPTVAGAQDLVSLEQQRKAAEQGNAEAQVDMGILYEFGFHMPKNAVNALAWYMRAAEQGDAVAIKRRDLLKSQMTPEGVNAAQQLSLELATEKPDTTAAPVTAETPSQPEEIVPAAAPTEAKPSPEKPPATP